MISKPILTIDKFSGMSDDGGTFYLDGFSVENENGIMSLDENYRSRAEITAEDLEDSQFSGINGMVFVSGLGNSAFSSTTPYNVSVNTSGRIFGYHFSSLGPFSGYIAGSASSGNYFMSNNPDIHEMESGSLIFTSARHISLTLRGKCASGSNTTKIIDSDGRDFTTLGIADGDRVVNIMTGEGYTITSITTTTSTNDTLNFNAGTANAEDDEFMVTSLTWKDLRDSGVTGSSWAQTRNLQFQGQITPSRWSRPIRKSGEIGGGGYLIGNGNYLAFLDDDEDRLDKTYKQLPFGYQLLAIEVGNLGDILVSAYNNQGDSFLLYWDGFSEQWNEIIRVSAAPMAMTPYKNGWVYFTEGTLFFTDGRNIEKIIAHPEADGRYPMDCLCHNAITTMKDKIFIAVGRAGEGGRGRMGVYVFDKYGLSFFKVDGGYSTYTAQYFPPRSLKVLNTTGQSDTFRINNELWIGSSAAISTMREFSQNIEDTRYRSVVLQLDLKQETQVSEVWLNLQPSSKTLQNDNVNPTEVTVNYSKWTPFRYGSVGSVAGEAGQLTNADGSLYPGNVGEQVDFFGTSVGRLSGERTYITGIENRGTDDETWTVSPDLSRTDAGSANQIRFTGMVKAETKTLEMEDLNKPIRFQTNFIGSTMYLEIVIRGGSNRFPISIKNIQLF